jgi:uncharacterized protein (TIGR02117 family)
VKRAAKWAAWAIAVPLALLTLFLLASWIGSALPRNGDWAEPRTGIEIMIETNGVHTAIVMPLVTPQKDWRPAFPMDDLGASLRPSTHVSVSWGEREVFLNTPTWADITPATILGAAVGGDSLLHIAHYTRPAPGDTIRPLRVTQEQYARLVAAIERQVLPPAARTSYPGYYANDVFYDAPGTYHLGNTCNQWTSDTLAEAGIRTGRWTPLAGGVMRWIPYETLDSAR